MLLLKKALLCWTVFEKYAMERIASKKIKL